MGLIGTVLPLERLGFYATASLPAKDQVSTSSEQAVIVAKLMFLD